jgi:pimeloyl-ACP methyl ester carboxylesterase
MKPSAIQQGSVTTADGLTLAVTQLGPHNADLTVILLHGLLGDRLSWWRQSRHLRLGNPDIRLVSYDQRGHGHSDRGSVDTSTIGHLAADLDAVIDTTTPRGHIVLVGHSMGAMTVLQYLGDHRSRHLDRVTAVGLIATAAADVARHGLGRLLATPLAGGAYALATRLPASVDTARTRAIRASGPLWRRVTKKAPTLAAVINAPQLPVLAGFLDSISQFDGTAAYHALNRVPTLIMCGTVDWVTPAHHSAAMAAAVAAAELVEVPAAGHMLMLQRPEVVNDRLDALLDRARAQVALHAPTPAAPAVPTPTALPRAA